MNCEICIVMLLKGQTVGIPVNLQNTRIHCWYPNSFYPIRNGIFYDFQQWQTTDIQAELYFTLLKCLLSHMCLSWSPSPHFILRLKSFPKKNLVCSFSVVFKYSRALLAGLSEVLCHIAEHSNSFSTFIQQHDLLRTWPPTFESWPTSSE